MNKEKIRQVESLLNEAKKSLNEAVSSTEQVENEGYSRERFLSAFEKTCDKYDINVELEESSDKDEVFSEWQDHVNMSASELQKWSKNPCSREASVDPVAVIRRNLRLLEKDKDEWTSNDVEDAERTISFISRMKANKPSEPREGPHGCPSEWAISLLNWAFNPFSSVPTPSSDVKEDLDPVEKVTLSSLQGFEFEEDDEVTWESGGGQAFGVVRDRTDDSCYDAAIDGDVKVCGEEGNPAYLIQIWNNEKRQLEDTMVAHKEGTLTATTLDIEPSKLQADEGNYEFSPIPDQVVYSERELAAERAEDMGMEGTHEHVLILDGEEVTMYMPGDEHIDWAEKVNHPRQLEDEEMSEKRQASQVIHADQRRMKKEATQSESESVRVPPVAIHKVEGGVSKKVDDDVEEVLDELWEEDE